MSNYDGNYEIAGNGTVERMRVTTNEQTGLLITDHWFKDEDGAEAVELGIPVTVLEFDLTVESLNRDGYTVTKVD